MNQLTVAKEQKLRTELVFENNGDVVTDSLMIAEMFGKEHDKVLRDIRTQIEYAGQEFSLSNFGESTYTNERGRILHVGKGYTTEEIARKLEMKKSTVHTRKTQAF